MHLTLHLTGRCNLRCRYCYAAPHAGGDMSLETAQAAIDFALGQLKRQGSGPQTPAPSLGVIFFGGEPLLCRDLIIRIVAYCRDLERHTGQFFHFKITTNGTLLDEAFLTAPETAGIFVALSHDGLPAAHDAHRVDAEGRGTSSPLDDKIGLLLRHKPCAPVMMVVNPDTLPSYADSVAWLFARGFRYIICSLNYAAPWSDRDLRRLEQQYRRLSDWYAEKTMAEEKFYFSPFEVKIASHIFPGSCRAERCELGRRQLSVAPSGRLYPCVQFVGDGLDDAWSVGHVATGLNETARDRLFAASSGEKETCRDCAIRERCHHTCGCLNRQSTGRLDRVSPVLCAHERIVLPVADRLAEQLFKKRSAMFIQKHYNELYPLVSLVEDTTTPCPMQT